MITALLLTIVTASWEARVTAAKALPDEPQRNAAMLELLREALAPRSVQLAGSAEAEHVEPSEYEPVPVINFDPYLQKKQSAKPRNGGATRSLANNAGYYFSQSGTPYVVVGPAALDRRSPVLTQMLAEHEMFHAENHVGDRRPFSDRELEAWSTMFVRYFDDIHRLRQRWAPMLRYYDDATGAERQNAVDRLVTYYEGAPEESRAAFVEWLMRREKDAKPSAMIPALQEALPATEAR